MLKDVFGFAEGQEKATYGLGYKLTLTRIKDEAVAGRVGGNIILLMLEFNSFSSSNFLSS